MTADTFTILLQPTPVAAGLPDADTDVLIFDSTSPEAQLGAYIGHDDLGPLWVDAQGANVANVTHWVEMPSRNVRANLDPTA